MVIPLISGLFAPEIRISMYRVVILIIFSKCVFKLLLIEFIVGRIYEPYHLRDRHKLGCTTTKDVLRLESLYLERSRGFCLFAPEIRISMYRVVILIIFSKCVFKLLLIEFIVGRIYESYHLRDRHKLGCTTTKDVLRLESLYLERSRGFVISM